MQDLAKVKVAEMKGSQLLAVPSHKAPTKITPPAKTDAKHQKDDISDLEKPSNEMSTQKKGHSSVGRGQPSRIPVYQGRHVRNDTCGRFQQKSVDEHNEIYVKKLHSGVQNPMQQTPANTQPELMTLHCLLHIPTGSGLTLQGIAPLNHTKAHPKHSSGIGITGFGRDNVTRNTYLVCRMFWSDDVVNSNVCWGTTEPDYEFLQIAPVLVSPSLLERTRNNFMIVEVWDKKTSAENDQLVGIVKLPLHQFYMSYRDPRISTAMLKSKFPVVAVDSSLPVVDPFTGVKYGQLKVLLSLGSQGQISELQRVKLDKESNVPLPDRPDHFLERANVLGTDDSTSGTHMIEHTFEVIVEGIRGFPQFQDTVWGEADCFVQYHFPSLLQQPHTSQLIKHAPPSLKPHRTATTLCIPEPMFHDICRHRLVIPSSIPVQRELLTACAGVGGGAGGIPFEVWCRYYCPNIRDQVLAKATLPLAKLCAMVTMQKRGETSVQSFSLPLRPQLESDENDSEKRAKLHDAGLLDITINYKTSNIKTPAEHGLSKPTGSQVCISVGILRACGLKAAAKSVARHDAGMQYPSDVGVNSYVKAVMSFLSNDEIRVTQSVARNFAPEFAHYVDFPCPLWFSEESEAGGISLAEVLESGDITFQVWHQVPGFKSDLDVKSLDTDVNRPVTARRLFSSSGDILLGSSTIPLKRLLTSKTGVKGWYPLYIPPLGWDNASEAIQSLQHQEQYAPKSASQSPNDRVGGGLEVLISLAHQHDQEKVIHAARSLGWAPDDSMQDMEGWPKQDDHMMMTSQIDINVDVAVFPVICALRAGQTQIDKHAKAYIRYKFYDKAAVLATLSYLDDEDGESLQADMQHSHRFRCHSTEPFIWYLKEERLEIQLWISYNDTVDNQTRPRQRDKLIGCSYLDLSPLAREFRETQRIGGRYPVFKPGAAYLGGAFLRVHVTRKQTRQHRQDFIDDEGTIPDDFIANDRQKQRKQEIKEKQKEEEIKQREKEETERLQAIEEEKLRKEEEEKWKRRPVRVHVVVEQAMHIGCHTDTLNTFYVSYQTTEGIITSPSAAGCDRITWGFDHEAKVNRDVLENQNLIFKIWQQTSKEPNTANDRVLGFVSVDLCPLLAGFKLINGWYNIMDFSGQCQGQLKIGISPLESISPLKQPVNPTQQSTMMSPRPKTTSFQSSSQYTEFPSHLVQYPEQTIQCCDSKSTEPSIQEASHFEDHLKNVRQFHESLQQKLVDLGTREKSRSQHTPSLGVLGSDTSTSFMMNSKSFLRRSLRDNLEQLDIIQENLKKKLRRDQVQGRSHPEDYDDSEQHRSQGKNHKHRQSDLSRGQARSQITSNHIKEKNHVQDNYPELITSGFSHFENGQQNLGSTNFEHHDADEMNDRLVDGYKDDEPYGSMRSPDERVRSPQSLENKSDKNEAESCMSAPTTYPVPTGELINLDNEISNLNNPRTFERDSSSNIHYERLENIEDLLPARPPPSHWDPLEQKTDSDWDSGSDFEEVIPKPLNDISSQEFSNLIVPDKVDKHQFKNVDFDEDIQQQTSSFNQPSDLKNGGKTSKPEDVLRTAKSEEDVGNTCGQQRLDRDSSFIVLSTDSRSQQDITDLQSENQHINDQNVDRPQEISSNKNGCGEGEYGNDNETENIPEGLTDHQALENDHQALQSDQTLQSDHQELESDHQALKDAAGSVSGEENADDNDSVVITINSEEAAMQKDRFERKQETRASEPARQQPVLMPNFFLPPADLEASMRALRTAASVLPQQAVQPQNRQYSTSKAAAVNEVADRLHKPKDQKDPPRPKTRNRPPTAEEAKRIAKIFSAKFSTS
ncbi:C2 domain-containing protein 3-like [Antedon mediterranea]|uniref:C2 domain-containing protein 3-like n=1 Tax=Antedon mediterranea TaxID=105859 RepID=UPI003AF8B740